MHKVNGKMDGGLFGAWHLLGGGLFGVRGIFGGLVWIYVDKYWRNGGFLAVMAYIYGVLFMG